MDQPRQIRIDYSVQVIESCEMKYESVIALYNINFSIALLYCQVLYHLLYG